MPTELTVREMEGGLDAVRALLKRLRQNICRCCGLKARGAIQRAIYPDECRCEIYDIHDLCAKCPDHCGCPGLVNAEGYWEYERQEQED